ncbi:SPFH domain, Band 7 family protein [Stanieria cyanosphaera PCC 7437]|uniref:SPFH domain, Band 7 family protein n=1 Tax=Stanieria cyanosphaera (strain ATCC 29371 / PCC 7437) TaxID=111780 RepID=K9XV59_STAC7|nr:prohibitin family protein [Stanieria cyanosphaera]AFZ35949.1 SPFH domain, Band 7 family protein [Stanieria cyanosphaera PCC 7437]
MKFIFTTITALISFIIALNKSEIAGEKNKQLVRTIGLLVGIIAAFATIYQLIFRFLIIIPAGTVGVVETFGKVSEQTLNPGVNWITPFSNVVEYSTRLKDIKETVNTTSSEGLNLDIDVSLQYRLEPQKAVLIYNNIGIKEEEILISRFRSIIRQITASHEAKDIYGSKRQEITQLLHQELSKQLNPLGFIVEESLLRKVTLPEKIQEAIQQKIEAEQESDRQQFINQKKRQELEFEIEKAKQEAERQKIEAQGIAEAQKLISQSLTEQVLQLKAIEATQKLAESQNTKIVIVGRNEDGLPLILQNP